MGENDMSKKHKKMKVVDAKTADGFANFSARMGLGADNVFSRGGYTMSTLSNDRLTLENIYRGSWIGGKIVDDYAMDMTRAGIDILLPKDDESKLLEKQLSRLGIWDGITDCLKWSRLYGGAIAVIELDGQDTATPLRVDAVGKSQFTALTVYDRWQLQPSSSLIQSGVNCGLPASYRVISSGRVIDASRVIRMVGNKLPYWIAQTLDYWGQSVIERLYDRLLAYDTVTSGTANLIQRAHLRHVGIEGLRDILSAGGQAEQNLLTMFQYVRELQTSEGLTLLDKQDELSYQSYSFGGLDNVLLQFGQQLSGACGIPLVRLFGQSPSGMSATGESDLRNYYDTISANQESTLRSGFDKILSVLYRSTFGQPSPSEMDFDFRPLWQMNDTEKATLAKTVAETVQIAVDMGVMDLANAAREFSAISAESGIFSSMTAEVIAGLDEEPPMPMVENVEPQA